MTNKTTTKETQKSTRNLWLESEVKIWLDSTIPAPEGYVSSRSVNDAIFAIDGINLVTECFDSPITLVDMGSDAGEYVSDGGDYIEFLEYCEYSWGKDLPFALRLHSADTEAIEKMRAIIQKNGWKEVQSTTRLLNNRA